MLTEAVLTMSEKFEKSDSNPEESDALARLLKLAGPRAKIPRDLEQRTYECVRREWQASTRQPSGMKIYKKVRRAWKRDARLDTLMRWVLPMGGATAAAIAIFVLTLPVPPPAVAVATVSKVVASTATYSPYLEDMILFAGETVVTGEGEGLSLLLTRSESLRIDENTEIRVDAKDRFTLVTGRVYVDTGQFVYRDGGLTIETSFGSVTDVGTQFSVSLKYESLDVAVREGRVDISNDISPLVVVVGERMTLKRNMAPSVSKIGARDEYWNWVANLAPDFDVENGSLFDFLKWAARETGRELIFENDELRMSAMRDDIHGEIANLSPDDALRAVLPTTSLRYRIEEDEIVIEQ